jgi:hypothetical protein
MEQYVAKRLGLPTPLANEAVTKIKEHYAVCAALCPDPLQDIFVDTVAEADGSLRCLDVTFFSQRYFVSAADFLRADDYVVDFVAGVGHGYRMRAEAYRLGRKAVPASRLYVEFLVAGVVADQARWRFRAAGDNCRDRENIMLKYLQGS